MADWKLLGEVPDSEDEDDFGSSQEGPLPTANKTVLNGTKVFVKDIWELTDSEDDKKSGDYPRRALSSRSATRYNSVDSSPLSSAQSVDDLLGLDQILQETHSNGPNTNTDSQRLPLDEISQSYVRLTAQTPAEYSMTEDASPQRHEDVPQGRTQPMASQDLGHLPELEDLQSAAVRLDRSLRPRKPIQEHPYLLENAHYSSLFRKHGVRPVQMAAALERRRREGKQVDGDFEDDSQESRLPRLPDSSLRDSGQESDSLRDLHVFDVPSSSPPKTSPWIGRAVISSRANSPWDTDDTSVVDPDLAPVHDLVSGAKLGATMTSRRPTPGSITQKKRRRNIVESDPVEPLGQETPSGLPDTDRSNGQARLHFESGPLPAIPQLHYTRQRSNAPPSPDRDISESPSHAESAAEISSSDEEGSCLRRDDNVAIPARGQGAEMSSIGRRIKGVLPASWLRLDQQTSRDKAQKTIQKRQRSAYSDKEGRRGVAQLRQRKTTITTGAASSIERWFFEETDEDEPTPPRQNPSKATDDVLDTQKRLMIIPQERQGAQQILSSDGESVIEDNSIDLMSVGKKRQRRLSGSASTRKRPKLSHKGRIRHGPRQPKITSHLSGQKRAASRKQGTLQHNLPNDRSTSAKRCAPVSAVPMKHPRISLLDVIEPNAAQFLRIAARTARRRADQGRGSPSTKSIRLATRADHIDAVSVLHAWKSGLLRQRHSVTASHRGIVTQRRRRPLSESSGKKTHRTSRGDGQKLPPNAPRKYTKSISSGGHIQYGSTQPLEKNPNPGSTKQRDVGTISSGPNAETFRPAQLEVGEGDKALLVSFHKSKRALDNLYTRRNRNNSVDAFDTISERSNAMQPASRYETKRSTQIPAVPKPTAVKRRPRKAQRPKCVDIDAPLFQHAADPLPAQYEVEEESPPQQMARRKLHGLGPYGTVYTTHFETFPLEVGVFFHDSTLLGSGALESLTRLADVQRVAETRPRISFQLGNQILRWGVWNDQTSSEFGVVLDTIADELSTPSPNTKISKDAAKFLAAYVKDSLSFTDESSVKSFIARLLDVLNSFRDRMTCVTSPSVTSATPTESQFIFATFDSVLFVTYAAMVLCRAHNNLMSELFQVEDLLRQFSQTLVSALLEIGTERLASVYSKLQTVSARERGIREDEPAIHSWALTGQILDLARIPRGSFWEVLKTALVPEAKLVAADAQFHERIWKSLFTILPLSEFTKSGVLTPGKRHETATDGWLIPQLLIRQVLLLYREDEHQAASFNSYCRALMSRCHYLVQQWGWRRSGAVVGVIFDFFGSQNLAHLRNEEVHGSPKFLEKLADVPSLAVEPEDKCFHIFLKLLALSIQKLSASGNVKDVRNLVARTIPNHNRQHLKEQIVYERDLAALRNHHDLLGTLFWSAPRDMRPAVTLIQRLVTPSMSHKAACLINIRSWNQLARFIAATGEAAVSFKPFIQWRNTFFQETLHQFDSVAADIQQQLHSLPKNITQTINSEMIDSMISLNKEAVTDVLGASVTASLDVMQHAANLEAASFCLNSIQLQHIFKQFSITPPEFGWGTLRAALATLDSFMSHIDVFKNSEQSQQSESQILNSAQADDALIVVDSDLSKSFFSMVRYIMFGERLSWPLRTETLKAYCLEMAVGLAARLGARLANGGLIRLPDMFRSGKYGLFDGQIHKLSAERRKYLGLFVSGLLKGHLDDFGELGFSLLDLWLLSLAMPQDYLLYQHRLAEQLRLIGEFYVPNDNAVLNSKPDYSTNQCLFEFAISAMRRSVRESGPSLKRTLVTEYAKSLKLIMEQLKDDLKMMLGDSTQHYAYVSFCRHLISLIRTHGSEFCVVDDFYYQISPEFSPSPQDPNLQVAAMISYGLRISEGDERVSQQLFFFLFNNFKMAMVSNSLKQESQKLAKGMEHRGIMRFVIGKMLPAALYASVRSQTTFPLLDVYIMVCWRVLRRSYPSPQISEGDVPMLLTIYSAILCPFRSVRGCDLEHTIRTMHTLRQAIATANALWPSVYDLSLNGTSATSWIELTKALKLMHSLLQTLLSNIGTAVTVDGEVTTGAQLFGGLNCQCTTDLEAVDAQVSGFTENIVSDAGKSWFETGGRVTARTPAKPQEEVAQGVQSPTWNFATIKRGLTTQIYEWRYWWNRLNGVSDGADSHSPPVF